jgi:hypothetical protein
MPSSALLEAARLAPNHPALRWTPQWNPDARGQHRRSGDGTACGITGKLVLAESDDPVCKACFPDP